VGARYRGLVGAFRWTFRHRRRHSQGVPVHVGRHRGFKVVSQGSPPPWSRPRPGFLVAIYAIIAYNYFVAKVGAISIQYKVFCEEFLLALGNSPVRGSVVTAVPAQAPGQSAAIVGSCMSMSVQIDDPSADAEVEGEARESIVAEINITPLTDVFLVLLIIFMVTSTAIVESEVSSANRREGCFGPRPMPRARHPSGAPTQSSPLPKTTSSNLLSRKIDPAHLEEEIHKALVEVDSKRWLLRGDKSVFLGAGGRPHGDRQESRSEEHRHSYPVEQKP